jgi:Restriction endonuclease XhoI
MTASIHAYETMMSDAIKYFWNTRKQASLRQLKKGVVDQGNRSGVTAGKNLDGFAQLVKQIIIENGISDAEIFTDGRIPLTIPGFYRPTKNWDLLVVSKNKLLAAIEFKSQVGPSFGNNFNNRVEEALGNATDINTAFREGAFGESQKPFLGYFFVLEDCAKSLSRVNIQSPHFPALPEFKDTSYAARYEILCRKLVQEQVYDAAALVLTSSNAGTDGSFHSLSELTSAKRFVVSLAGKISGASLI